MTRTIAGACFITLLAVLPTQAQSQDPATNVAVATSLAAVPVGATIRVQTVPGAVFEGPLRMGADSVFITTATGQRAVAFGDVRSAWYRQRETRTGAVAGAVIGGLSGGAFLGLLAFVFDGTGSEKATLISIGVLSGAAAGGLLGGVVGAAVPRWTIVYPAHAGDRVEVSVPAVTEPGATPGALSDAAQSGRRRLGSLEGAVGYGRIGGDESTSGGPGGRLALHAEFGTEPRAGGTASFISVGPEIARFDLGSSDLLRRALPPADTIELRRSYVSSTAGGVLRGGIAATSWRAYGLVGLAYHRWEIGEHDVRWISQPPGDPGLRSGESRFEHVGYSAGAGAHATVARYTTLGLELRHTAAGTFDMDLPAGYWTITLTAARRW